MDIKVEAGPDICKKIQNVLELRIENDKEGLEALNELSTFFPENNSINRRNLQSTVLKQALDIHENFLECLMKVQKNLRAINLDVNNMNDTVEQINSRLLNTMSKTRKIIDQTTQLQKQIVHVEVKHEIAELLVKRFQLSEVEITAIKSGAISADMLSSLDRCSEISRECDILLKTGCNNLGQDITQQMTKLMDIGLDRIFKWIQTRCRTIDQPDPGALLPEVMAKLERRPQYFDQVLEEYNCNRRDLMVRQLITALTRGGNPIEHRVTNPKRYIGDMLAWLHQAIPSERDNLLYLLKKCDEIDVANKVQSSLCSITEGVSNPLKVRIEHILLGENNLREPVLLQEITVILRYYHEIILQLVGVGALEEMLGNLVQTAERTLLMSLTARVALLLGSDTESAPTDLSLTSGVDKTLGLLGHILNVEPNNFTFLSNIVACVMDPVTVHITERAVKLPPIEAAVFQLNCFHALENLLALHPFLDERLEKLKNQTELQLDTLTSEQATALVTHLGLTAIYTALQKNFPKPLSKLPVFDSSHITSIGVKLQKMLTANEMYLLPQLTLLFSTTSRFAVERRSGTILHGLYEALYRAVNDPENLFQNPTNLLPVPPDDILKVFTKAK